MTWEIFMGIAALSAFMISILNVVSKITRILTNVDANLKSLSAEFEANRRKNDYEHTDFTKRLCENEKKILISEIKLKNSERM